MLIDPSLEDPSLHLTFDEHKVIALSARGQETIDVLGLNGSPDYQANVDERRKAFEAFVDRTTTLDIYRRFWDDLTPGDHNDARLIQIKLLDSARDFHEYSAMFKAATLKHDLVGVPLAVPLP